MDGSKARLIAGIVVLGAGLAFAFAWYGRDGDDVPAGFASGNGRIEATEVDIAARLPGRIREILVKEADFVEAGQVLARMDTQALEAELAQAQAMVRRAESAKAAAGSVVAQRNSARATALAVVAQRESDLAYVQKEFERARVLVAKGFTSAQKLDDSQARVSGARAALSAAHSQVLEAQSAVEAALATVERLKSDIEDATLKAPRGGRVEYRIAQPGEIVPAGGKILTVLDVGEVYMTFFLPETVVGRVAIGAEARIVLDAAPQRPVPARVSFVASSAQFTPRTVETREERQKLMFRVRAQVDAELLKRYRTQVKTGLPGVAYVRLDPAAAWPQHLQADWARK